MHLSFTGHLVSSHTDRLLATGQDIGHLPTLFRGSTIMPRSSFATSTIVSKAIEHAVISTIVQDSTPNDPKDGGEKDGGKVVGRNVCDTCGAAGPPT